MGTGFDGILEDGTGSLFASVVCACLFPYIVALLDGDVGR